MSDNPFVGSWTYRSFNNDPTQFLGTATGDALCQDLENLVFGNGTIVIDDGPMDQLTGTIGGSGWSLALTGSRSYGDPMTIRFQGKGVVGPEEWIYAYVGYLVPQWPNGVQQVPAIVGSIVRVIPHQDGTGHGAVHPAGVVASWYAVRQDG